MNPKHFHLPLPPRISLWLFLSGALCCGTLTGGCGQQTAPATNTAATSTNAPPGTLVSSTLGPVHPRNGEVWRYTYELVKTYPHDSGAFTQGLVIMDGKLFESTGLNGQSSLREVELDTGKVLRKLEVPAQHFAEGLAILNGQAFQLTWQSGKAFVYDLATFKQEKEFSYTGEGWGLATDGKALILSDGTPQIRFLDPATFQVKRSIQVTYQRQLLNRLNELEYIRGEIFANVWQSDYVVRIDPETGAVLGVVDFRNLLPAADRQFNTDVLNGIAYDAGKDRLFVTGKLWPKLFEVRLKRIQ